jgi:hypothetical protein
LPAGTSVTTESLRIAGIVKSARLPVKVLGDGEIAVALTVEAERFSASARTKIEAAGGTIIELNPRPEPKAKQETSRRPPAEAEEPVAEVAPPTATATEEPAARRGRGQRAEPGSAGADATPRRGRGERAEPEAPSETESGGAEEEKA